MQFFNRATLLVLLILVTSGCTTNSEQQKQQAATNDTAMVQDFSDPRDPFETVNRELWDFNWNILDKYLLRPLAVGYSEYLPQPAQTGVRNFVTNLEEPGYALNSLLQGKVKKSGTAAGRFVINSTIGILGIFDVAKYIGLEQHKEDFGQTMAVAGVGNGPYAMIPVYGPTTARDFSGDFVDGMIFPLYLLTWPESILKLGVKAIYTRADLLQQERMINSSTDSYIFVKEVYFQSQNFKIHDGNPPLKKEEEFDEAFLDEID
ncbi:VacJ family lipoprotein [Psychrosphaera aquimarina]|jgi:phospholipid-binding lipoprotein MlaA|uniref:VacJ family lipoprotein n=1 Tax=Psychrosphaera aquimarina TaxID=2044854 RepID=A0ABU3R4M3_9GAMM|nr:VacJ family lipoprotein [Psychrosphaera aquimarina]MDU0114622.1 VacJ family lipoprotein [Psychrosphaera aquimarina]